MIAPPRVLPVAFLVMAAGFAAACSKGAEPRATATDALAVAEAPPPVAPGRPGAMVGDVSGVLRDRSVGSAFGTASSRGGGGIGGVGANGGMPASRVEITEEKGSVPQPSSAAAIDTAATTAVSPAMLIRTGSAVLQVDSLERAITAVQDLARRFGGYVANTNVMVGEGQPRRADLELKFPAARFDEATTALRPLGKVEGFTINTQDVGEEFVDMTARMSNARRLEERLIDLLARRTGKLEDMLMVERELARVREEIERYEGRLRFLRSRASLSTLSVTVHEPAPVFEPRPGPSRIGEAFREAWRNFVGFLATFIASLGWLVPLVALVGALVWAGRRWLPSRPAPAPAPSPRPTPITEKRDAA